MSKLGAALFMVEFVTAFGLMVLGLHDEAHKGKGISIFAIGLIWYTSLIILLLTS